MRLKKCLVILPLLALTLSGCNNTKVSDSPESSSSSESEQTSGEITALSNYTLSFTFYSSGIKSSIPDYASAYIIGDWDWNTFLPLTEADGVYSYTFSSIEVGTHEYKGVMWYSDETVSWNNCVEIITQGTGNATFTVRDSDGDGYTQYIDCTLNATLEPKSTEGGEGETSSSDSSTSEDPTTGGSSSSENPGAGEGSSSDGSTSSGNTGEGETNNSYAIEVADEDSLKSLEYSGTPLYINLAITLITYDENNTVVESKTANADDVTFSGYDSSIVTFNEQGSLRGTIVGAGSTSLTITWGSYATKTIEIIVIDTTGGDDDEDLKTAKAILEAVADTTITWDAFHGEYIDESIDETDVAYLTTDNDGLYGSILVYDDGDLDCSYYYANGYEYYTSDDYGNPYEINESYFYLADTYDECLEEYTDDALSEVENLTISTDNYTLTSDGDGYELIITSTEYTGQISTTYEYVYIVDTNYELTAIAYSETTFQGIEGWYAEKATSYEVEASMSEFNPDDWSASTPTELDDYTLKLKFTLAEGGEAQTIPETASLFLEYWKGGETDSGFIEIYQDSSDGTYSVTFAKIDITYYSYCVYLGYTDDEYHTPNTCYELVSSTWFTVDAADGSGYTNTIEHVLSQSFDTIIPTTYTFYISIYYGNDLQSAPEGTTIYATGVQNDWDNFVALTPADNGTYALTVNNLSVSYFNIQLVLAKTEASNVDYTYRITADGNDGNVYCQVTYCTTSTNVTATAVNALDSLIPADARTTIYNYTLSFTFTYGNSQVSLPTYTSAYISYGLQGSGWGSFIELTSGNNDTYYITFDSIDAGTYGYQIILALANTSPSWDDDHMITDGDQTFVVSGTEEDNYTNEITIASKIDVNNTIQDPSTIESRSNCKITYYFVNNASSPTEYYEIPSYADAYICGYLTSTDAWTDYSIGGNTKLSAAGSSASDGYSVTLETIHTGEVTYNMYFEYNANSQYHSAANEASWSHGIADGTNNTTMNIPTTGECQVYIEVNPSSIITDEPMTNAVQVYVVFVDSGNYSGSFSWTPWMNSGGSYFNDLAYCECVQSTTGSSKKCLYNSVIATLEAGSSDSFYCYDQNLPIDISTGTITIPTDNTSGYAVYVCNVSFPSGGTGSGSWHTNVSDIATLISSL